MLALGLGAMIPRLTRETGPDAFIPADHAALLLKERVEADFGVREPIVIGVIRDRPGGIFLPGTLRTIRDLTRRIQNLPHVNPDDVLSIAYTSREADHA